MVKIDKNICIGCGTCEAICDEVFEINDETQKAEVKPDANLEKNEECISEAIESCPVEAISK